MTKHVCVRKLLINDNREARVTCREPEVMSSKCYYELHRESFRGKLGALTACESHCAHSSRGRLNKAQHMDRTRMCVRTVVCMNAAYSLLYVNISSHAGK